MLDARPRILSVGTANPPDRYQQAEVLDRFRVEDPRIRSLFTSSHIRTRHLYMPPVGPDGAPTETQGELLAKHLRGAMEIGPQAVERCLGPAEMDVRGVDHLVCISTTGFLAPGLSAHLMKRMGFREDCSRADIVGMGCNATEGFVCTQNDQPSVDGTETCATADEAKSIFLASCGCN